MSFQDIDLDALKSAIADLVIEEESPDEIAQLLVRILPAYVKKPYFNKYFSLWEEHGFHLTPVYFSQPIPDTRTLTGDLWEKKPEVVGIDWNDIVQTHFLRNIFPDYQDDYNHFPMEPTDCPYEFHLKNGSFEGTDAMVLYCMVRHFRPNLIIEVGSGFSTRVSAQAALRNGNTRLISIEPYPDAVVAEGFPGLSALIQNNEGYLSTIAMAGWRKLLDPPEAGTPGLSYEANNAGGQAPGRKSGRRRRRRKKECMRALIRSSPQLSRQGRKTFPAYLSDRQHEK